MKKANVAFCLVLLAFVFSSCAPVASTAGAQVVEQNSTSLSDQQQISLKMVTPVDGVYTRVGCGTESGYYLTQFSGTNQNIMYIDFATRQMVTLSSDIAFDYNADIDTSTIDLMIESFFEIDEKIYITGQSLRGNTAIYQMERNGSNQKIVANLPDSASMKMGIATDGTYLYTTLDIVDSTASVKRQLCRISLENGAIQTLSNLSEYDFLYGASGQSLYIKNTKFETNNLDGLLKTATSSSMTAYDVITAEMKTIFEWPAQSNGGAIHNGFFYFLIYETGSLSALNLSNGETRIIAENLPTSGMMDNMYVDNIWDNRFVYRISLTKEASDTPEYVTIGVHLDSGDVRQISLHGGFEEGAYLPILHETNEAFLVQYNHKLENTAIPGPDGVLYQSQVYRTYYALISKSFFWSNNPQYQNINVLTT